MALKAGVQHIEGLPSSVVGPVDLGRLLRELEALDNALQSARLRSPESEPKLPKTSRMLDEITDLNKLDLLKAEDRTVLKEFLATVKARAPHMHMSFSADPSPAFTDKILQWLRSELHPALLLTIGLQPGIGAGCVVRTANKYFDLSLAKDFEKHSDLLMDKLRAMPDITPPPVPAPITPAVPTIPQVAPMAPARPSQATTPQPEEVHA